MSVSVLANKTCSGIGEGPHWDEDSHSLLYVDITGRTIHKFNTETGTDRAVTVDEEVGFVVPRRKGGCVIGQQRSICLFDWDTASVTKRICEVDQGTRNRLNDSKCDASGRLWTGSMGHEDIPGKPELHKASLYSLSADHTITRHVDKISVSNGMAWTSDNTVMYYIDSTPRKVYAFDFDLQLGSISNRRVVLDFGSEETLPTLGYPDGMCLDQEGKMWVACFLASKVIRFDPQTGKQLQVVDIPALRTTSCCFGGKNYDELFVTCAVKGANPDELNKYPLTGSVFKVTGLGVKGTAAYEFAG